MFVCHGFEGYASRNSEILYKLLFERMHEFICYQRLISACFFI